MTRPRSKRYFTGKPCMRGHIAERLVSSRACTECSLERGRANADQIRKNNKIWYAALSPEQKLERSKNNPPKNKAKRVEYSSKFARENPHYVNSYFAARESAKIQATPKWADLGAIREIYAAASAATELFEIPVEVDHFYPLRSKIVCGLHCEANLRLLTALANQRKHNHMPTDRLIA